jgi:hypothetical protein
MLLRSKSPDLQNLKLRNFRQEIKKKKKEIQAQVDRGGGGILLGDNTGGGTVML